MKYRILRPLPYSADGIRIQALDAGSEHEILADLVPGLVAEGYIAALDPAPPVAAMAAAARPQAAATGAVEPPITRQRATSRKD